MGIIFTKNKRAEKVTELGGTCINNTVVVTVSVHPLLSGKNRGTAKVFC